SEHVDRTLQSASCELLTVWTVHVPPSAEQSWTLPRMSGESLKQLVAVVPVQAHVVALFGHSVRVAMRLPTHCSNPLQLVMLARHWSKDVGAACSMFFEMQSEMLTTELWSAKPSSSGLP